MSNSVQRSGPLSQVVIDKSPDLILNRLELDMFARDGFVCIPQVSDAAEIELITKIYDDIFERKLGWSSGDFFDFSGVDDPNKVIEFPQMLNPSKYEPRLRDTRFRTVAHGMARQLLGPAAELVFEHAMMKRPNSANITTWHQDEAFYPRYTNYKSITFWMPLQAVSRANGCMEFIPGSNNGPLHPHHSINNDPRIPGLEADDVDPAQAVPCPLAAGGCTIHGSRTLHYAGPNQSNEPRRAYALGFGVRSRANTLRHNHPWNQAKITGSARRAQASQSMVERAVGALKQAAKAVVR